MALYVQVDSFDYKEAVKEVDTLLSNIHADTDANVLGMPNAAEIVDAVIAKII